MLNITHFASDESPLSFLIVSPHSSQGNNFFNEYPQIFDHPEVKNKSDVFKTYIKIESDFGAQELAHAIAKQVHERGFTCIVCELDYPRGLLDGGRQLDHCLREALPASVLDNHQEDWLQIHQNSLTVLDELYDRLNKSEGLLLDIHTMASFSPMKEGKEHTFKETFDNLESYCQQFLQAPKTQENLRSIDIISQDGSGNEIGCNFLKNFLALGFREAGIDFVENHPYVAEPAFLMNRHLLNTRGIAIDVPKHMLANIRRPQELNLDTIQLDENKIEGLARIIAKAAIKAQSKKGPP